MDSYTQWSSIVPLKVKVFGQSRINPIYGKRYPLYRRLGWPEGQSGQVQEILSLLGFNPQTTQAAVRCSTDYAR
jgi:hypothetical protein